MRITHKACLPILTSLVLFLAGTARAQDTTYTWVSSDSDLYGIYGTITLDSPNSAGGTLSDVISFTIGSASQSPITYTSSQLTLDGLQAIPFTWDSSQITSIDLEETANLGNVGTISPFNFGPGALANSPTIDFEGSWLNSSASVPESPSVITDLFLGLPFVGLALRNFRRQRRME
jgi:hypothetical protein